MVNVVLISPEIPQNTGNVSRTCVMTGASLHLVKPLGFSITQKEVKRAGLDYWPYLKLHEYDSFQTIRFAYPDSRFIFFSTRGSKGYDKIRYREGDFLVFGCETRGLPEELIKKESHVVRIPMVENIPRSLNLSNSVALVLYEALRQNGFPNMV